MKVDPVATRYADALFETAKAEGALHETLEQLQFLGGLMRQSEGLRQLFWNPDVDPEQKVAVVDRLFNGAWAAHVRAFVHLVVSRGRAPSLPAMVDAFQAAVDVAQGRLRVTVRCARPLPEPLRARLVSTLQRHEHKSIELREALDPALVGGVQISFDHWVVDGSVQRQLEELRQRLTSVRVHSSNI